jgi:hypothetical protein
VGASPGRLVRVRIDGGHPPLLSPEMHEAHSFVDYVTYVTQLPPEVVLTLSRHPPSAAGAVSWAAPAG